MKKIIFYNFLIFFISILLIEIFFGFWFDKDNFGIFMRKHRMQKDVFQVKFEDKIYKHVYRRNFYGFRGEEVNPQDQKIIFIGGSTGNQKFTPERFTIVEQINTKLNSKGINQKIYNASMDGKSTFGIINDFEFWFPKLENFKPKLFIFYIGLNDKFYRGNCIMNNKEKFDINDCKSAFDLKNRIIDYIKNNSITYYLGKKFKHRYFPDEIKIRYHFEGYKDAKNLYKNFNYINYDEAKSMHNFKPKSENQKFVDKELYKRLKKLNNYVKAYNAEAIYITQIQHNGLENEYLFFANEIIKKFCRDNKLNLIALDEIAKMSLNDFYDPWHTSLKGSTKIADYISEPIINIIKNIY